MILDRDTIGKALESAGVSGKQLERAQDSLLAAQEKNSKPTLRPWTFPAFTLNRSDV